MIRVCFASTGFPMDDAVHQALRNTLEHLADTHCYIEFWYNNCHHDFERASVEYILELKEKHPDKQFEIVAVLDPLRKENEDIPTYSIAKRDINGFPLESITRYENAPTIVGKAEQSGKRFIIHHKKVVQMSHLNIQLL